MKVKIDFDREIALIERYEYEYFNTPTHPEYKRVGGVLNHYKYAELLESLHKNTCGSSHIFQTYVGDIPEFIGTKEDICDEYDMSINAFYKYKIDDGTYYAPNKNLRIVEIMDRFYGLEGAVA